MIIYSIMMFFLSIILIIISITLLTGNTASMHGRVFRETSDKKGYAKESGLLTLFLAVGIALSGASIFIKNISYNLTLAIIILFIFIIASVPMFLHIQKKYDNKQA